MMKTICRVENLHNYMIGIKKVIKLKIQNLVFKNKILYYKKNMGKKCFKWKNVST